MLSKWKSATHALLLGALTSFALAATAIVPLALSTTTALAQGTGGHSGGSGGHEDGGEDGGHEDGGTDAGHSGSGKGRGGHHTPAPAVLPAAASTNGVTAVTGEASLRHARTSGQYLRFELGGARYGSRDANWLPPGFPGDPQVFFDLDVDNAVFGAMAIGHTYSRNLRAEVALNLFGSSDFAGPWTYTLPATTGPHADMSGSVKSVALMANGYYSFDTVGKVTPFVTAGLGLARNTTGIWTRTNTAAVPPTPVTRSFSGASKNNLAWTVGLGVAMDVGPVMGSAPATLELAWRYFDLGTANGGSTPVTGGPGGVPVAPLNFNVSTNVISVGLRIPLN